MKFTLRLNSIPIKQTFTILLLSYFPLSSAQAIEKFFSSGEYKVSLVELYTSEGCSSCPPAEKWIGTLKDKKYLWEQFVPIAFHVDYWDYIGWKDRFAQPDYGLRQREYKKLGNIRTVYTPGMILNGREWRKWHYKRSVPSSEEIVGKLDVQLKDDEIQAVFSPADKQKQAWELNVAVLGFNLESDVNRGENAGRKLKQEFVVLGFAQKDSLDGRWTMALPKVNKEHALHTGLAVWVNKKGEQTPVQATGGWLLK